MANFFTLTLDTTGPSNPSVIIDGGASYSTDLLADLTIGTSDGGTFGYQMKIWGDVDLANDVNIQGTEALSSWITYAISKQVKLTAGDGSKTMSLKLRDDVYNESSVASDSVILDTTKPVVNISGPDVNKVSEITGKDKSNFSFTVDTIFEEYKVKVVSASGSSHDTGILIPLTAGSTNMSGSVGGYAAITAINSTVDATDLKTASAGDGAKIVKVFVLDSAGNWSV